MGAGTQLYRKILESLATVGAEALRARVRPAQEQQLFAFLQRRGFCFADVPYYPDDPFIPPSLEQFQRSLKDPLILHDAFFLAVRDGKYIGLSYLAKDADDPSRLLQRFTGVHPDYRRQGVGLALKRASIRYAHHYGYDRIKTATASAGMLAVNRQLGYQPLYEEARLQVLL